MGDNVVRIYEVRMVVSGEGDGVVRIESLLIGCSISEYDKI